jgi:HPt (histidine-containing phosphotransfer) domain-containing protein
MIMGPNKNDMHAFTVHIDSGLEEIVPGFLENRRSDVETLHTALKHNDFNTICLIGHRMKGDGGGYGFDAISRIGEGMEQAAARQDCAAIGRHLAELIDFLAHVIVVYQR